MPRVSMYSVRRIPPTLLLAGAVLLISAAPRPANSTKPVLRPTSDSAMTKVDPFRQQIVDCVARLEHTDEAIRARGAEALGFLRCTSAADSLQSRLDAPSAPVRREAALALGSVVIA